MNKSTYSVALVGLLASSSAFAGASVGVAMGSVVGAVVGASIAQATGLSIEAVGSGAMLVIAASALVLGIRIVRRKQAR
ncbi:MAG TPA: hypothetical protein VIV84_05975 [Burkholderiaceae bacterium]